MGTEDKKNQSEKRNVTMADVLLAIVNGFFNLIKLEKAAVLVVIYLVVRDAIFVNKLSENSDVSQWLIETDIIANILNNDNRLIFVLGCIIFILVIIILILLFFVIPLYKKEIERLAGVRSDLMHKPDKNGNIMVKKHRTSKR